MSSDQRRIVTTREGPPHAGVGATFCGRALVEDPGGLAGADVAVLGAPFDDGTSNRPGARYGPRAIRAADDGGRHGRPHMTRGVDPFEILDVVDYGDIEVFPADLGRSHQSLAHRLGEVLAAGGGSAGPGWRPLTRAAHAQGAGGPPWSGRLLGPALRHPRVDIDVLDPAFAPGTGTPEPGGLTTRELLWELLHASESLDLCAADVVEVCPPADPQGITALAAERAALEILTGIAARRTLSGAGRSARRSRDPAGGSCDR